LVEDALFCHKCGKAQRELLFAAADEPVAFRVPPPPPPSAILPPAIGFHNSLAVRLSFLVASVASVLDAMPIMMLFFVIWSVTAGFVAVVLYRRATGLALNIRDGAKLGWITGVLNSLILTVLFTISVASSSTEINAALREQVRTQANNNPAMLTMVDSPYFLASMILFGLFMLFIGISVACVAGGALGARILRDDRAPGHQPR
jgi:hypothetical protein